MIGESSKVILDGFIRNLNLQAKIFLRFIGLL